MSNNLDEALRILKRNSIPKKDVAVALSITPSHLSRILNGEFELSQKAIALFNKKYGKYVTLSGTSVPIGAKVEPLSRVKDLEAIASELQALCNRLQNIIKEEVGG